METSTKVLGTVALAVVSMYGAGGQAATGGKVHIAFVTESAELTSGTAVPVYVRRRGFQAGQDLIVALSVVIKSMLMVQVSWLALAILDVPLLDVRCAPRSITRFPPDGRHLLHFALFGGGNCHRPRLGRPASKILWGDVIAAIRNCGLVLVRPPSDTIRRPAYN